jgi:hypothetical protein
MEPIVDAEKILLLIENHGLAIVILFFFIIWLRPKVDDMWNAIMNLAKRPEPEPAKKEESLSVKVEKGKDLAGKMQRYIQSMLGEFRSDRVYIFQYHNGGRGVGGIDFIKVSCTYETVTLGTRPQQKWLQQMPITLLWAFVRLIDAGVGVVCPCIEECFSETDASTYETLRIQGIKSCYCVGLYSDSREPIGFVGVDYCASKRTWTKEELTKLQIHAERLSAMFCASGHESCEIKER